MASSRKLLLFALAAGALMAVGAPARSAPKGEARGGHWAFKAPQRAPLPAVDGRAWLRSPIDAFVLARLEKEALAPSPEADRAALLRRAHLDLIGLPPEIEDLDARLAESRPDAFERDCDRLLASPHYGERWGRQWLDAARYADSDGYEKDKLRQVWFYRDWVVSALNRDLSYDRFIIEQLAGDLLPGAGQDEIVATGFLRNSMVNEEGGIDPEQFRMEAMFDRMDAIGKSILGLTIQCSQCHDHKYDPLKQAEYYGLFAYLNNDHEANVAVYNAEEEMLRGEIFRRIREIESALQHRHPDWRERMARWEEAMQRDQPEWQVLRPEVDEISTGGQKYLPAEDGSFLAQGYAPTKHTVLMTIKVERPRITAFRLELLTDPNLPLGGPGRSIWGTAALTEFEVDAAPADGSAKPVRVKMAAASADVAPPEKELAPVFDDRSKRRRITGPVGFAIDGKDETAWGTDAGPGRRNQARKAVFVAEAPIVHPQGIVLTFHLKQNHGGWNSDDNQNHNLGRFRLSVTDAPEPRADPLPARTRAILQTPRAERGPAAEAALFGAFRESVPEWREANEEIEALWRRHPEGSSQLVLSARPAARDTRVLARGDFLKPERPAPAGVPAFLNPIPEGAPATRLTFARWLADPKAPTTARAFVNRVWQSYFGTGLVSTSEDLGVQCEPPSHPELLDWLAVDFVERGWGIKDLHRRILGSAVYRQISRVTPALLARDPYNLLLARGPRFRVEGEAVRDIALAASGLLDPRLGGPSVFPPLPEFMLLPPVSYGPKVWPDDGGGGRYRRALYAFRYRSVPYPVLQAFDAPNGDFSCVRRSRSNTPLQALMTLNEPVFIECARALGMRALLDAAALGEGQAIERAFRRCTARRPLPGEAEDLLSLYREESERFSADEAGAWELAADESGRRPALPEGAGAAQLASWTLVARVLLNLDETITKE